MTPFSNPEVQARFNAYPPGPRKRLLALRELVFRVAAATPGVGEIAESLKWGEPSYTTSNKAGSPFRMDWKEKSPDQVAMYFNCQTDLVEIFRTLFPQDFRFEGNRALVLALSSKAPEEELAFCIAAALIYRLKKREGKRAGIYREIGL
ncbi:DUF1801 domain-containing protein [Rhodoferax saidenbachensis]|uniref:YdhG-like domain-containing protein n=1 Tax=Rhodoferax saidenbachensis TaxID=1484693 RepID=A0A1P8K7V0_9BURK|nr:DUF1801 domain-containing protein [Rhodoferax saidenbachensis]APW42079.1 hypothetical protein RS694_05720 [Rhodoferax saidenbachensis]